jgi:hypothetical protein
MFFSVVDRNRGFALAGQKLALLARRKDWQASFFPTSSVDYTRFAIIRKSDQDRAEPTRPKS